MWLFGYGSLVWKVDFPIDYCVVGFVKGFYRRFWQGSTDHRGYPHSLGRVATLIKCEDDADKDQELVWGIAYKIKPEDEEAVNAHLKIRETVRAGYTLHQVIFNPSDQRFPEHEPFELDVFIGTPEGPLFLGAAPIEEIAHTIAASVGPSGKNAEYLLRLAARLHQLAPHSVDNHLFELEKLVKAKLTEEGRQNEIEEASSGLKIVPDATKK